MDCNLTPAAPEASTDERASSLNHEHGDPAALPVAEPGAGAEEMPADQRFATMRAEDIYWAGVSHGRRSAAESGAPPPPPPPPPPPAQSAFEQGPPDDWGNPTFLSPEADRLYWTGYLAGARASRPPEHPHMDDEADLELTRDSASPELVSSKLLERDDAAGAEPVPAPGKVRAIRHDGLTGERQRIFLDTLAATGVVSDACRAADIGRDAVYALRKRAAGAAFAIAWDAAILSSRRTLADDVMSRARNGVIDRVYRDGKLVAERHRYDNRLTMSVLTRLDRLADGMGEGAATARTVVQEWDQFLDVVEDGGEGAEAFLRARSSAPAAAPGRQTTAGGAAAGPAAKELETVASMLARLATYKKYEAGLASEIDISDLDPSEMERWSEEQWARAEFSGFLERLPECAWPEAARSGEEDGPDGMCRVRRVYLDHRAAAGEPEGGEFDDLDEDEEEEDEEDSAFEGCGVWRDEDGSWRTDFPPPDDFIGWDSGEPGEYNYRRELTEEELEAVIAHNGDSGDEDEEPGSIAAQHKARERFFALLRETPAEAGAEAEVEGAGEEGGGGEYPA